MMIKGQPLITIIGISLNAQVLEFYILRAMIPKDGAERKKYYLELKRAKKRDQMQKYREKKGEKKTEYSSKKSARYMRKKRANEKLQLEKEKEKKEKDRVRHFDAYHRKKGENSDCSNEETPHKSAFRNKFHKCRTLKKVGKVIPDTPTKMKEAEIIAHRIKKCPLTRKNLVKLGVAYSEEAESQNAVNSVIANNLASNLKELNSTNGTLPENKRKLYTAGIGLATDASGKATPMSKLGKKLGVNRKKLSPKQNVTLLQKSSRKKRKDAIPTGHLKIAHEFWISKSRPTGDRRDIKRKRIGPKSYKEHAKQVLEKTEREIFLDFKNEHPNIKMGETMFRRCKPFFVVAARKQDRKTCLCRKHVELRMVLRSCAKFRSACYSNGSIDKELYPPLESVTNTVNTTLCPNMENNIQCLSRNCQNCGVYNLSLSPVELDFSENAPLIKWQCYGYVEVGEKEDGEKIKKLTLINKETKPGELYNYLKDLIRDYPYHDFMAHWQKEQYDILRQTLPLGHVLCVHDYSENYQCNYQNEIQSLYFSKSEASLHVTVLFRHSTLEYDGEESTIEKPVIVKEHIFSILDDKTHDNYAVHQIRCRIDNYLKNTVKTNVKLMHEFCDGCSAQYKSRHCMGDVSLSQADFGYPTWRNFFETSHAKGEQDSAGAHVKQKCAMAVIRQEVTIGSPKEMFEYLSNNFTDPVCSKSEVKRRVFFHIEGEISRRGRTFQAVPENRKIHSILSDGDGKLLLRKRSCYCDNCLDQKFDMCSNRQMVDAWTPHEMSKLSQPTERVTRSDEGAPLPEVTGIAELVQKESVVALAADDPRHDYYLIQVTSDGAVRLDQDTEDAFGNCFLKNTFVFKGYFFEVANRLDNTYKLNKKHLAMCHVETVRYIASEMESFKKGRKNLFRIPLQLHEDILAAL